MKLVIYGASGKIGSAILAEALRRGHTATAVGRHPENIATPAGVTAVGGDARDAASIAATAAGAPVAAADILANAINVIGVFGIGETVLADIGGVE